MTNDKKFSSRPQAEVEEPVPTGREVDDRPEQPETSELPSGPGEPEKGLLYKGKVRTAAANKKVIAGIAFVFVIVATLSFMSALTPPEPSKKKQEEQQAKAEKQEANIPATGGTAVVSPVSEQLKDANYGTSTVPAGVPNLGAPQNNILPGAVPAPSTNGAVPAPPPYMPGYSNNPAPTLPSPQEERRMAEAVRIEKMREDAKRSGLKFGNTNGGGKSGTSTGSLPTGGLNPKDLFNALSPAQAAAAGPSGAGGQYPAQDQNRQEDKNAFASKKRDSEIYLTKNLNRPVSPYEIKAGSIIPITLITEMNTDLPGYVTAQVRETVYDSRTGRYTLIPQGTRIVGEYDSKVTYGQSRALIVWTRLIFPNGSSISLEGMPGVDLSGAAGYKDLVNNHLFKIATAALFSTVLNVGAKAASGPSTDANPSLAGDLASGAGQAINQVGQRFVQKSMDIQPTIRIRKGTRVNIFVHKDMILVPYKR